MKKLFFFIILYVCSAWQTLEAQEIGNSYIYLEFREFDVRAKAVVAVSDLEFAYGKPIDSNITSYIAAHIRVKGEDGITWLVKVEKPLVRPSYISGTIHLNMIFSPAIGFSTRRFVLNSTLVNDKVLSHRTYVIVNSDWDNGISNYNPEGIGILYSSSNELNIYREPQNLGKGFVGIFNVGAIHIRKGFDHILFMLMLVLATPLLFTATRRDKLIEIKKRSFHLFKLAAIFASGHAIALLFACVGWIKLPVWAVEIFIAIVIIVSAIHVFWPILANKEWSLSLGFGVLHGLAFSNIVLDYGLSAGRLVVGVIGLNLGILGMQLLVMLSLAPWFFIAAESSYYNIMKYSFATAGMTIAAFWIREIVSGLPSSIIIVFNSMIDRPVGVIAFMAVISLLVRYSPGQTKEIHKN